MPLFSERVNDSHIIVKIHRRQTASKQACPWVDWTLVKEKWWGKSGDGNADSQDDESRNPKGRETERCNIHGIEDDTTHEPEASRDRKV